MSLVLQVAVGVALAPVVFALSSLALQAARHAMHNLPYLWEDHPNLSIALCCGIFALVLAGLR